MNTTIQIRIDKKTKDNARKIFKKYGLTLTSGIILMLHFVNEEGRLPFPIPKALRVQPKKSQE